MKHAESLVLVLIVVLPYVGVVKGNVVKYRGAYLSERNKLLASARPGARARVGPRTLRYYYFIVVDCARGTK